MRGMKVTKSLKSFLTGVALAFAAGSLAIAVGWKMYADATATAATSAPTPGKQSIAKSLRALHGAAGLPAPTWARQTLQDLHPGTYADARLLAPDLVLASRGDGVCLVTRRGLSQCRDRFNLGHAWIAGDMIRQTDSVDAPFDVHIYGVALDTVDVIHVAKGDGTLVRIPVRNNVFRATLPDTEFDDLNRIDVATGTDVVSSTPAERFFPKLR